MPESEINSRKTPGADSALWELADGQRGIWYHQCLHPESPIHNVGEYVEIRG
jgi:hypothetical protein